MRGGAHRGDTPAAARLEVARRAETGDERRSGGRDTSPLAGAARAHLGEGAPTRGTHHPSRRTCDRGVVVEHRQGERLENDTFGEHGIDDQDGGARKVDLSLLVAADASTKSVVGEPVEGGRGDNALLPQPVQLSIREPEIADEVEKPPGTGHDAVAAAIGKASGEHFEDAVAIVRARLHGRVDHREFVAIRQQRGGHGSSLSSRFERSGRMLGLWRKPGGFLRDSSGRCSTTAGGCC